MMRITRTMCSVALAMGLNAGAAEPSLENDAGGADSRPRVVLLSDFPPLDVKMDSGPAHKRSDPDDIQSMVRFLVYANEFEIEGLAASSATFANVANKRNILDILELYDSVDEKLREHDARYPTADQLRAVTWQGASGSWGKPAREIIGAGKESEASERIIALLDEPDARPIYFPVWGGSCDLAQALWKIRETRGLAEAERVMAKARVYLIAHQDGTGEWLLETFPKLHVISAMKSWQGIFGSKDLEWINENVRNNHGPLGAAYPTVAMGTKPGIKEGDSPSFLYLASAARGLNDPEFPDQPSWGGQFVRVGREKNHWIDDPTGGDTVRRWSQQFDNDFAARMDWCVKERTDANHPPAVWISSGFKGGSSKRALKRGEIVKLEGAANDPDGHRVTFKWWNFSGAEMKGLDSDRPQEISLVVPNKPGEKMQIILEGTDAGTRRSFLLRGSFWKSSEGESRARRSIFVFSRFPDAAALMSGFRLSGSVGLNRLGVA